MLTNNEIAVLELLAIKPLSYFPPIPRGIADQLLEGRVAGCGHGERAVGGSIFHAGPGVEAG